MDWKKIGIFRSINRIDVWQNIFEFLDVKTVLNGLSKSCKTFKILSLLHISHIKSICILSLNIDNISSYTSMIELLKCEKTFLLKINSNTNRFEFMNPLYQNKSVIRFQFKAKNGNFSALIPMLKSISNFKYIKISGNTLLPEIGNSIIKNLFEYLYEKKITYLKISKVTLDNCAFNTIAKFIKFNPPMIMLLDIHCKNSKAEQFQNHLAKIWKNK